MSIDTQSTMTYQFADRVLGIHYSELPADVIDVTKRVIIDGLACAIGGFNSPTGQIVRNYAKECGGAPEATLIGTGDAASISAAIIANEAILRYLDYNDDFDIELGPGFLAGCHPSGSLPVALAVAEKTNATGSALIEAIVGGYEVMAELITRFRKSLQMNHIHHGSVHPYGGAVMAGLLMGLDRTQLVNAMGVAGGLSAALDILDAEGEEYDMSKNVADGFLAERGYVGALLSKHGLTGPARVIEGRKGFAQALLGGQENFDMERPWGGDFHILHTEFKSVCTEMTTQGHLHATTCLVNDHDIKPEDISEIVIRTNLRTVNHCGDPVKKYPKNKETADHSSYFLTAMAVIERQITPKIYAEENYSDPRVKALIDKTRLEHGSEFDGVQPAAEVIITLSNGEVLRRTATRDEIHAIRKELVTDEGLRGKFLECAEGLMTPGEIDGIIETCLNLEKQKSITEFLSLLRIGK